ncbi:MAG: LysR family transcriptional regulator [Inquilinaceae bacterium]
MSKPLDRLTLLETFVRIADRGSITAAARDLGLSQASASRQLKELEDRLTAQLIRRTTHALSLTPAGQDLLRDAQALIAGWDALADRHGASERTVAGRLKVVAPVALGQLHLADMAVRFQLAHPGVSVIWVLEDAPIRFAEVGCDCWIKVGPVPDDTLIVRPLGRVERLIVAAPALVAHHAIGGPEDLAAMPCAALDPFDGGRIDLTAKSGAEARIAPDLSLSTNNIFALHRAALLGAGFAVLPRWFVEDDLAAGRLIDVLPDWRAATLTINAAFLPARHQPKRLGLFLDALLTGVGAIPGIQR